MPEIASVVLFTADFDATVALYRAVGLPLADEDHGEGPVHAVR
jgi:catechol 2,3-dioxygenase-like lactoylglutathione lyase family enzyme